MTDLFEEVEEQLRSDRYRKFARSALPWLLGFAAIAGALKTPGHAIVLVPLRPLLAQGGVLDRLRSQGLTVKTPGEE